MPEEIKDNTNQAIVKDNDNNTNTPVKAISLNGNLNKLDFFNEQQLLAFENFATKLMRSEKGGVKSVNDALAIAMRAQALNLPFGTALDHIHVISGKTGVDIHIIKALLMKGGCTWECTKNYAPIFEYTDGFNVFTDDCIPSYVKRYNNKDEAIKGSAEDKEHEYMHVYPVKYYKDFNNNVYKDYRLNDKYVIVTNRAEAINASKQNLIGVYRIPTQAINYVTEFKFTRKIGDKEVTCTSSFSLSDAINAKLTEKEVWVKYIKQMISHRAFTYGARDIAADLLMGCMELTELKMLNKRELTDEDFEEVEVL